MMTKTERKKGNSLLTKLDNYTVIDIETTGRSIYKCEIIELSAVRVRENKIVDEYTTLVCPAKEIPADISKLTGITNEMIEEKPAIDEVLNEYIDFLGDDILLGHNINSFDLNILYDLSEKFYNIKLQNDFLDTLRFVRHCDVDLESYKLKDLAEYFNVTNEHEHRSLYDCRTNHFVYQELKQCFTESRKQKHTRSCNNASSNYFMRIAAEGKAVKELQDALRCILDNNLLDVASLSVIDDWLKEHSEYIEKYPFNEISQAINSVLEDGVVDELEQDYLIDLFYTVLNPLSKCKEYTDENIDINGKNICITGNFINGSRSAVKELFISHGAKVTKSVTGNTNFLIVGKLGNKNWKCGSYGSKIQKAIELQQKGNMIKIIGEKEFFEKIK